MIASISPALELLFLYGFHNIPHLGLAPLVVGAIIMAGTAIATAGTSAAIGAIPTKTEKEIKAQKEALGKEIARTPGLTEAEREEFAAMGTSAVAGAERELYSKATELAALEGLTGADLVALQRDIAEQQTARRADVAAQVRQLEMAARQQKEEEYKMLQQATLQSELARKGAVMQGVQQTGAAAQDFATMVTLYESKYGSGGGAVPESVMSGEKA
jgi:hypothetical protein